MPNTAKTAKVMEEHTKWVNLMRTKIDLLEKFTHIIELKHIEKLLQKEFEQTVHDITLLEMMYVLGNNSTHDTERFIGGVIHQDDLSQGMNDVSNYYGKRFNIYV